MIGRLVGRAWRRNRLGFAIVSVVMVVGGLASVRECVTEPEGQQVLAQRLCRLQWWDARETAAFEPVVRDRSNMHVADIERQATSGLAVAQCALGMLYKNGWGVPRDDGQAAVWWRKAAEQGHAQAQFLLGVLYEEREGVPQDFGQAAVWYRKAAERGYAPAQLGLGVLYQKGRGVPQDSGQAAVWYRKAAEQGHAGAQFLLGALYEKGEGVPQDFVLAYLWASLAASRESEYAWNRDRIAGKMTTQQIAEAQRLAREWQPKTSASP